MKDVKELNRDQLVESTEISMTVSTPEGTPLSETAQAADAFAAQIGELADVDETISDEEVYIFYAGFIFSPDDFFCTAGQED